MVKITKIEKDEKPNEIQELNSKPWILIDVKLYAPLVKQARIN